MLDRQLYGLPQVFKGKIVAFLNLTLYFIHADAALIAASVPEIHIEYPVAPLFRGEKVG